MKTDVIIGAITGLTWPEIRPYAVSLSCSGFEGEMVMLVNGISPEVRDNLAREGFVVIDFDLPADFKGHSCDSAKDIPAWTGFGQYRYKPAIDFLAANSDRFRYVIWTDVRDLIFQTNPIDWLEDNLTPPYRLVVARECWKIKDQPHNNQWAKFTAPNDYEWLKEEEVLCAGSVAGEAEIMLELFSAIWRAAQTLDPRANDQGIFNYLMRQTPFKDACVVPSMAAGFAATGWKAKRYAPFAYSTDDSPVFNVDDYVVYTPDGVTPFAISHQYDRDVNWKICVEKIMESAE